jgi:hypothetical protein
MIEWKPNFPVFLALMLLYVTVLIGEGSLIRHDLSNQKHRQIVQTF